MAFGNLKVVVMQGLTSESQFHDSTRYQRISIDAFSAHGQESAQFILVSRSALRKLGEVGRRAGTSGRHFGH